MKRKPHWLLIGIVFRLVRQHGMWRYTGEWDPIWSYAGSAECNVFRP